MYRGIKNLTKSAIREADQYLANRYIHHFKEKPALLTFLFHSLFRNREEIDRHIIDPQQEITVDTFRSFIVHMQNSGYNFIAPDDILNGLDKRKQYAMITFDDGYYNNHLALEVLQELNVPAVFFISSNHIRHQRTFWWDVVYRNRRHEGKSLDAIYAEIQSLKAHRNNKIESYILNTFGPDALKPVSDLDRPFTPKELKDFARSPLVILGNHTCNHAILTNYNKCEILKEYTECQEYLKEITGKYPNIIAYPNGNYNTDALEAAEEAGLPLGITVDQQKNRLPLSSTDRSHLKIKRYLLWGNKDMIDQCNYFRSDFHLA
ncbi:MAG: hypothetical protein H6Q00_185 [Holophagaceae bacterium]|nr:hypothetical protein [Holophagaceae bacterium]